MSILILDMCTRMATQQHTLSFHVGANLLLFFRHITTFRDEGTRVMQLALF